MHSCYTALIEHVQVLSKHFENFKLIQFLIERLDIELGVFISIMDMKGIYSEFGQNLGDDRANCLWHCLID